MQFPQYLRLPAHREQEKARGAKANGVKSADLVICLPLSRTGSQTYMPDVQGGEHVLEMRAASVNSSIG